MAKSSFIIVEDKIFDDIIATNSIMSSVNEELSGVIFAKLSEYKENSAIFNDFDKCIFLMSEMNCLEASDAYASILELLPNLEKFETNKRMFVYIDNQSEPLKNNRFENRKPDEAVDTPLQQYAIIEGGDYYRSLIKELVLCSIITSIDSYNLSFSQDYLATKIDLIEKNLKNTALYMYYTLDEKNRNIKEIIKNKEIAIEKLKNRKPQQYILNHTNRIIKEKTSNPQEYNDIRRAAIELCDSARADSEADIIEARAQTAELKRTDAGIESEEISEYDIQKPTKLIKRVGENTSFSYKKLVAATKLGDSFNKNEKIDYSPAFKIMLLIAGVFALFTDGIYIQRMISPDAEATIGQFTMIILIPILVLLVCFGIYFLIDQKFRSELKNFFKETLKRLSDFKQLLNTVASSRHTYIDEFLTIAMNNYMMNNKIVVLQEEIEDLKQSAKSFESENEDYFKILNQLIDEIPDESMDDIEQYSQKDRVKDRMEENPVHPFGATVRFPYDGKSYWIDSISFEFVRG